MSTTRVVNVVIADSCPLLLLGIREVLAKDPSIYCAASTEDLATLLQTLGLRVPDVLVYDPVLEGPQDRGVIRDLHRWYPGMGILVFSSRYHETAVMQALRGGALGYLLKNAKPEELLEGVRSVAAGKRFISIKDAEGAFEVTEDGMPMFRMASSSCCGESSPLVRAALRNNECEVDEVTAKIYSRSEPRAKHFPV